MSDAAENIEIAPLDSWDVDVEMTPAVTDARDMAVEAAAEQVEQAEQVEVSEPVVEESVAPDFSSLAESKDYELRDGKLFVKAKVAGEEDFYDINELKNNFAGKTDWTRKYTELDKERKAFLKEKQQIESYVNNFRNMAQSKDMVAAAKFLGELSNLPPHEVVDQLIASLAPEINRRSELDSRELELEKRQAETEYQRKQIESRQSQMEAEQKQSLLDSQINEVMSARKISDSEWDEAFAELDSRLPADENITPELVGEYVSYKRINSQAGSILSSFEGGKYASNSAVVDAVKGLIEDYPDFSQEDYLEVLEKSFKPAQQQQLEEKVAKKVSSQQSTQKAQVKTQYETYATWDDIL